MSAEAIARTLGNPRRSGRGWWQCRCPVCQTDKLGVRDGARGLEANCFKLCKRADIMAELGRLGLLSSEPAPPSDPIELEANRQRRIAWARSIWDETVDANGTIVQTYLNSRLCLLDYLPPETIRLQYGKAKPHRFPAMCCRIDHVKFGSTGVHITYLLPDGSGKASIDPVKRTFGLVSGGSVQIGQPGADGRLVVAEGIETCISLALSLKAPGWAALSASGLKTLILPPEVRAITIAADNDDVGKKAARKAARRWLAEGREVEICTPPIPGTDWNDALLHPALRRGVG